MKLHMVGKLNNATIMKAVRTMRNTLTTGRITDADIVTEEN